MIGVQQKLELVSSQPNELRDKEILTTLSLKFLSKGEKLEYLHEKIEDIIDQAHEAAFNDGYQAGVHPLK